MSNGVEKPETNRKVIFIVVGTLAINATIGIATLAYSLIANRELNAALLTAYVGLVNYVLGALSGMLVKTSPTETTKEPLQPSANTQPIVMAPPDSNVTVTADPEATK